jgi:hypothetical protein
MRLPLLARLMKHVDVRGADECWEWTSRCQVRGYGRIRVGDRLVLAHRLSYELARGPLVQSLMVCHTCDNRLCCNPAHLFAGSSSDNMRDMHQKKRHRCSAATACPSGHPYSPENTRYSKAGKRKCRACGRKYALIYSRAKRSARLTESQQSTAEGVAN